MDWHWVTFQNCSSPYSTSRPHRSADKMLLSIKTHLVSLAYELSSSRCLITHWFLLSLYVSLSFIYNFTYSICLILILFFVLLIPSLLCMSSHEPAAVPSRHSCKQEEPALWTSRSRQDQEQKTN